MLAIKAIGEVENNFTEPAGPEEMLQYESTIIINDDYTEGLYKIEDNNYLQILFYLDEAEGFSLKGPRRQGQVRGLFASRSPHRPSPIGVTLVELLERRGNRLRVKGLDAINGTPVIDIKPYASIFDNKVNGTSQNLSNNETGESGLDVLQENPREEVMTFIENGDLKSLLIRTGALHGHFCPYVALGVKAGAYALQELNLQSEGMEDVAAVIETNSCFADGIQYTTGCTLGNNALIYRDYGKTAVTITARDKQGLRLHVKDDENLIENYYPQASRLFKKVVANREGTAEDRKLLNQKWTEIAFSLIEKPVLELFDIETTSVGLPEYAPIFEDEYCDSCGEKIMAPKAVKRDGDILCIPCAGVEYYQLDGRGLNHCKR